MHKIAPHVPQMMIKLHLKWIHWPHACTATIPPYNLFHSSHTRFANLNRPTCSLYTFSWTAWSYAFYHPPSQPERTSVVCKNSQESGSVADSGLYHFYGLWLYSVPMTMYVYRTFIALEQRFGMPLPAQFSLARLSGARIWSAPLISTNSQ